MIGRRLIGHAIWGSVGGGGGDGRHGDRDEHAEAEKLVEAKELTGRQRLGDRDWRQAETKRVDEFARRGSLRL